MSTPNVSPAIKDALPPEIVVAAVSRAFRRHGYEGTTMSVLSQETGLGRSSLYHHFGKGKAQMALAALDRVERLVRGDMTASLTGPEPLPERARRFAQLVRAYYEEGRTGCLLSSLALDGALESVAVRVREITRAWLALLADTLVEGGAPDPEATAARVIILIHGGLSLAAATGETRHFLTAVDEVEDILAGVSRA